MLFEMRVSDEHCAGKQRFQKKPNNSQSSKELKNIHRSLNNLAEFITPSSNHKHITCCWCVVKRCPSQWYVVFESSFNSLSYVPNITQLSWKHDLAKYQPKHYKQLSNLGLIVPYVTYTLIALTILFLKLNKRITRFKSIQRFIT